MKRILFLIPIIFLLFAVAQAEGAPTEVNKRVAILETVDKYDKVAYGVEFQLRAFITDAVNKTPGYEGYDRVDMSQINKEHNFQRTGMVSDADIKKLGEMTGASSIVVAEAADYGDGRIIIAAKIINIESGRIENSTRPKIASPNDNGMETACNEVVAELLGVQQIGNKPMPTSSVSTQTTSSQTITVNGISFKMIRVDGGSFTMGATSEQGNDAEDDERPTHMVNLSTFYIGETEVTQELWEAVMGSNPSYFKGGNRPVEQVSWEDCQTFISELNSLTGKNFRLPTEAEWEFAARGGNKSQGYKYSGSNIHSRVAWYNDNSASETRPVMTKSPNELGLYDMSGNVWEWCEDCYGGYTSSAQTNPTGPSTGSYRVHRGGSWYDYARLCRVSIRGGGTPDARGDNILGLRLAL